MKHKWKISPRGITTKSYYCKRCHLSVVATSFKNADKIGKQYLCDNDVEKIKETIEKYITHWTVAGGLVSCPNDLARAIANNLRYEY